MAVINVSESTLQFVVDALRTMAEPALDMTMNSNRAKHGTPRDVTVSGHKAVRNGDGTGLTVAQIATAANLTVAQVTDIAGRI